MNPGVLLINPAINPASQNKVITSVINKTFPTSIGVLAGYLMSKGIESVQILDEQIDIIDELKLREKILSITGPRVVGLSVLTINSKRAYELSGMVKRIDPDALVVLGGIHPTVVPEEALSCKEVDVVVRGGGRRDPV